MAERPLAPKQALGSLESPIFVTVHYAEGSSDWTMT
jgi:hypothetical protein